MHRLLMITEWLGENVIMKIILFIALIFILAFVVLPSIAFLLGLTFYAKEALKILIGIFLNISNW